MFMENSQYNELIDFLTRRFDKIDQRFERIDERFDGIDEQLVGHDTTFVSISERLDNLENGQDRILGELLLLRQESTVSSHRSRRMEEWIIAAAQKIGIPYNP